MEARHQALEQPPEAATPGVMSIEYSGFARAAANGCKRGMDAPRGEEGRDESAKFEPR